MQVSTYHMFLRVSALTLAFVLLFDSGIFSPVTRELSQNTQQYLAQAIGVGASVKPTEINTLSAQIAQRNRELDARETAIEEREISVGLNSPIEQQSSNVSTYILSVILFILVVLIVLNYALDFARERQLLIKERNNEQTV